LIEAKKLGFLFQILAFFHCIVVLRN